MPRVEGTGLVDVSQMFGALQMCHRAGAGLSSLSPAPNLELRDSRSQAWMNLAETLTDLPRRTQRRTLTKTCPGSKDHESEQSSA